MKHISHFVLGFATLMVLLFGSSGVALSKCACTGRLSLVLPLSDGCCPTDGGCMTYSVFHTSTAEVQSVYTLHHAFAQVLEAVLPCELFFPPSAKVWHPYRIVDPPPLRANSSVVLRI